MNRPILVSLVALIALAGTACGSSNRPALTPTTPVTAPLGSPPTPSASPTVSASPVAISIGFYDGHRDSYMNTDVSDKAQAAAMHINYSPGLAHLNPGAFPSIYMVSGSAAPGQITVFGSEPGETSYSPIWDEVTVTWKPGATPVLLTSDSQIDMLASQGMLTEAHTSTILNCPILAVGSGR